MDFALVTLGRFALTAGTQTAPPFRTQKARALAAYLISHQLRDVSRDRLLELFWPEFETERARESLRTTLSTIRRALRDAGVDAAQVLIADKSIVRWNAPAALDAERFCELARSGDIEALHEAQRLYCGDFLEGNYEDWAVAERERFSQVYEAVLLRIVKSQRDEEAARKLLERNPYAEDAYAVLIDAEVRANRPVEARTLFARYCQALSEVGGKPSDEFAARFDAAAIPARAAADDALILPFVGRHEEAQLLDRLFSGESCDRDDALWIVAGEAGIGKTAFLLHVAQMARQYQRDTFVIRGAHGQSGGLDVWRALYESATGQLLEDAGGRADVPAYVASETVAALKAPSVLLVDDAHMLRGDAFATLTHVARCAVDAGHTVLAGMRPEGAEQLATLSAYGARSIFLGPLKPEDVRDALTRAINADAADLAGLLFERSGGHPLFLVSLIDSLVRGHSLRRDHTHWRVVRMPDERMELPRDLRASVEARLRAAGDDAAVVACALALEPSARIPEITHALEYAEPRVLDALDRLLEYSLVAENRPAGTYAFIHDIVREVAACMLNIGRRVALHRAFARDLLQRPDLSSQLRVAHHLRAAGMIEAAARAYANASQAAMEHYAFRDAMEWSGDALQLLQRGDKDVQGMQMRSEVHRIRAQAAAHAGEFDAAASGADEAVRYARSCEDGGVLVKALLVRASSRGIGGDCAQQAADAAEAALLAEARGSLPDVSRSRTQAAAAARCAANGADALTFAREACSTAKRSADPLAQYAACEELLRVQAAWWLFDGASGTIAENSATAERAGAWAQARWCSTVALCLHFMERRDEAHAALAAARKHARSLHDRSDTVALDLDYPVPLIEFTIQYLHARFAYAAEHWDAALAALQECRLARAAMKIDGCRIAVEAGTVLALLARRANGDLERAREHARTLPAHPVPTAALMWADDPRVAGAYFTALTSGEKSAAALRFSLDVLEENAHRMPLDCDRAFARLADIARACSLQMIEKRAAERSAYYCGIRTAAAAGCGSALTYA